MHTEMARVRRLGLPAIVIVAATILLGSQTAWAGSGGPSASGLKAAARQAAATQAAAAQAVAPQTAATQAAAAQEAVTQAAAAAALQAKSSARATSKTLKVVGTNGTSHTYTIKQLKSTFTLFRGYAGYVKTGLMGMQAPRPVKGVLLTDLLKKVGYDGKSKVTITASDGYKIVLSSKSVKGKGVTVYKAAAPYAKVKMPADNPLKTLITFQQKTATGAKVNDANPWKYYSTQATAGSDAEGPFHFWFGYKKYAKPGYVTIGRLNVRMVTTVTVAKSK